MNADLAGAPAPSDAPVLHRSRSAPRSPRRRPSSGGGRRAVLSSLLLAGAFACAPSVWAQASSTDPREMTVEELEAFIAEQKAALEIVRENRDITAEKAREVNAALEAKEAERLAAEEELKALCEERETLEPGSYDECLATLGED